MTERIRQGEGRSRHTSARGSHHLCAACRARRARFRYRGEVRADHQHVLCFQCYRSARERMRAWELREGPWLTGLPGPPPAPPGPRRLTPAQVEHRQRMLAHLGGRLQENEPTAAI